MSWDKLRAKIQQGDGQGHGEAYRPWIRILRGNPSPCSTQAIRKIPPRQRRADFMCVSEMYLALLFSWAGATDIREQFPEWPWPHPHPLYGLDPDLDGELPHSRGTRTLCREAGIVHGTYIGTTIPYVWTMDQVVTLPPEVREGHPNCTLVSVKPLSSDPYQDPDPLDRRLEKLEIERRYAKELDVPYYVAEMDDYPGPLLGQLDWLAHAAVLPVGSKMWKALQASLEAEGSLNALPPAEIKKILEQDHGLNSPEADYAVQHCLWAQIIDADLSHRIDMSRPVPKGGRKLRRSLLNALRYRES